ncbi:MAG: tetratricopeptide repeat protein [Myxococcota bacterium]
MSDAFVAAPATFSDAAAAIDHIDALLEEAWTLRSREPPKSNAMATEARALSIAHGYKLGQARANRVLCMTVVDDAGVQSVFGLAEEAKQLFDEVGDDAGRAGARDFLSSLYEYIGDLTMALTLALDALAIAEAIDDPIRQGYALTSVGSVLAGSGDVDAGVERLQAAMRQFERAGDTNGITATHSRLIKVWKEAGRTNEALQHVERFVTEADTDADEYLRSTALALHAESEQRKGQYETAIQLYRDAVDCFTEEPGRSIVGSEAQISLARCLLQHGDTENAEQELLDALQRIEGNPVCIVAETKARAVLAELYEQTGDLRKAIDQLRRSQALKERIAQREARSKLSQVELRSAITEAQKDAEIHKLRYVELRGMQAKLIEAEKMAILGKLAAGAAHELNSPLGVLRSNAELVVTAADRLTSLVDESKAQQSRKIRTALAICCQTTFEALDRVGAIADSFRRFAQLDEAERRPFDVREGIESTLAMLHRDAAPKVTFEREYDEVPNVDAWPRELNQAFMTVLENAIQAIDDQGIITIRVQRNEDAVSVDIQDTGRGMSPTQVDALFDVAWSHDGSRTKMRLGLAAAQHTMLKHGGTIHAQSALGQGTTIAFRFPVSLAPERN